MCRAWRRTLHEARCGLGRSLGGGGGWTAPLSGAFPHDWLAAPGRRGGLVRGVGLIPLWLAWCRRGPGCGPKLSGPFDGQSAVAVGRVTFFSVLP